MKFSLLKSDKLPALEQALASRREELDRANAAHKVEVEKRNHLADQLAHAVLDDAATVDDLEAKLNASESKIRALGLATQRGHEAVAAAEQKVTAERERDARAANAASVRGRIERIAKLQAKLVPLLNDLQQEAVGTFDMHLVTSYAGGGPQVHRTFLENLTWLNEHLGQPGGLDAFLVHLEAYVEGIQDGSRPADLGYNYVREKLQARG